MAIYTFQQALKKQGVTAKDVKVVSEEVAQPKEQSFLQDAGQDIKQVGTEIASTFRERQASVQASKEAQARGEQTGMETFYQTAGQASGLVSDVVGSILKGAVKTVLPQSAEESVKGAIEPVAKAVMESPPAQVILDKYNSLDERTKRNVDAALGIGNLALDVATLGVGKKTAEVGAKTAVKGAVKTLEASKTLAGKSGQLLKGTGEAAYGLTVTPTIKTAQRIVTYEAKQPTLLGRIKNFVKGVEPVGKKPVTEANTAARLGLTGTEKGLAVEGKRAADGLWKEVVAPAIKQSKTTVDMKQFINELRSSIKTSVAELGRRADLLESVDAFADAYKNVGKISLSKLQDYKSGWTKFLPEKAWKGKAIGTSFKEVQNLAGHKAGAIIRENMDDVARTAYQDWGNLQSIIESGTKSLTGDAAKKSLGRNVWEFVMDKAVTPVATYGGKVLYRTGEGLEFWGKTGAKTVKDVI